MLQKRWHEEHERCLLYLDASTRKLLVATAEKQLLECHISAILDKVFIFLWFYISSLIIPPTMHWYIKLWFLLYIFKGFTMLMDGNRIEDLQRMYTLFSRDNSLESLRQTLSSYILVIMAAWNSSLGLYARNEDGKFKMIHVYWIYSVWTNIKNGAFIFSMYCHSLLLVVWESVLVY